MHGVQSFGGRSRLAGLWRLDVLKGKDDLEVVVPSCEGMNGSTPF
jgi:hypothetical protein